MPENYVITNTDNYNGNINKSKFEQSMREMVNKHPKIFDDKKWDKYRSEDTASRGNYAEYDEIPF